MVPTAPAGQRRAHHRNRVVDAAFVEHRQPKARDEVLGVWHKLCELVQRGSLDAGGKKHVFAAVAGDA
jgi:hypothetical protein